MAIGPDGESALSEEVGARLREHREEHGLGLRQVARDAAISPGHLSDIENGRSQASLPVLIRLCRVLRLPLNELLPRLGGRRVLQSKVPESAGKAVLSHPELDLVVDGLCLEGGDVHRYRISPDEDCFVFLLSGKVNIRIDGDSYDLSVHDSVDIERAGAIEITATEVARLIVARGSRR